jgi:UDP-2,3-diacylglucosamine pyrophosphatase LpxH
MNTKKKLMKLYISSKVIEFDESSKFILFSDCHRGDNSWADDFAPNQHIFFHAMNHYYDQGFTYIEIGDGDELWEQKRFSEIRNAHSHIYWLLKKFHQKKRLILIFGNHNMQWKDQKKVKKRLYRYFDERKNRFKTLFNGISVYEGLILQDTRSMKKIFLFHGHQGDLWCDTLWRLSRFLVRHLWKHLQLLGVKDPTSPAKNYKKLLKVERKIIEWVKSSGEIAICGHTHRPKFPLKKKPQYFNTGSCVHPRCITGIEIQARKILLIKWSMKVNRKGMLYIGRDVLEGPKKL